MANTGFLARIVERAPWLKPAAIATVGTTLLGGGATIGYNIGKHVGASRTADAMSDAFSQANVVENKQIADNYYEMGLEDALKEALLDKDAALKHIYENAFNDELAKK